MDCIDLFKRAAVALQTDPRYLALDQARKANDNDENLQNLIGEFNLARMDLNNEIGKSERDDARITELNEKVNNLYGQIMGDEGMTAYNEAKRAAKDPETFGTGNPQGVVATESANNATVEGALIPLLAMGIPGSPPAAIIFGALLMQGITPGPELFSKNGDITYAFMFSFFVCNILMVILGIFAGKFIFDLVKKIPTRYLIPGILLLTMVGSYAIRNNGADVMVMFASGLIGYFLKELEFDPGPIVLGLILGPIAERGFVQGICQ